MTPPILVEVRSLLRPSPVRSLTLRRLLASLIVEMGHSSADVRVRLVGERSMRRWNMETFGKDRPTDVISFPEEAPLSEEAVRLAGDVLLCPPICLSGTDGWEGTPEERVFYFLVHAALHLEGHEHVGDPSAARRMRRRETALYRAVTGREPG